MKHKLALAVLTVLFFGMTGQSLVEALTFTPVTLSTYSGVDTTNYYADSILVDSGSVIEKTTAASDTSSSLSLAQNEGSLMYIGFDEAFDGMAMDVDTSAANGSYKLSYWNGSSWATLQSTTSASIKNSSSTGVFKLTWDRPASWDSRTLGIDVNENGDSDTSDSLYFVKLEVMSDYDNAATIGRMGIIDYNLAVEIVDETGNDVPTDSEDFVLSSDGNETVYAGKSKNSTLYFALHSYGSTYTYTVTKSGYSQAEGSSDVDKSQTSDTLVLESNNNGGSDGIDLTVSDLSMNNDDLLVKVENTGDLDVNDGDNAYLYVYVDGDKESSYRIDPTYLESNETLNVTFTLSALNNLDHEVEVEACVDATDNVNEDNESNNCRTENFGSGTNQEDFEITDIYVEDDDLYYTIANTGDSDASGTVKVEVTVEQDNDEDSVVTKSYSSSSSSNDFFNENEETTYNVGSVLNDYYDDGSDFDVTVCVDIDDDFDEESENNNCMTVDDSQLDNGPNSNPSCGDFTDIINHWAEESICNLYDRGILDSKTHYYPNNDITRAEFLKMTLLGLDLDPNSISGVYYNDVSPTDWFYEYVTYATAHGIVDGYEDGNFKPNEPITRAEAIVLLLKAADQEDYSFSSSDIDYYDVKGSDWFAWAVVVADDDNIMNGYSNNSFGPNNDITRAEAAIIVDLSYQAYIQ